MTDKELLKQYNDLLIEIADLEIRIKKTDERKIKVERDKVKGSSPYFPYESRNFNIEGYNYPEADKKEENLNRLNKTLQDRRTRCIELKLQIEEFISSIPDSRTRRVFQYRYYDGLEWLPISRKFGKYDESYSRKIHERYLEKL